MQKRSSLPWDIYEEHLDEGAFLWSQWERALASSNHTIGDVALGVEERLLAHLDGLVLGGSPVAERLLLPALSGDDHGHAFVAAWVLLQSEDADRTDSVWDALIATSDPARCDAVGRAFELALRADLSARLEARLGRHDPRVDAVIVDVIASRDPARLARLPLRTLGATASPELLGAVLRAVQRVPVAAHAGLVEAHLSNDDHRVRAAAIEAGTLLRLPSVRAACRQTVAERKPATRAAMAALAALGNRVDHERLQRWLDTPDLRRDALWAIGSSGRIDGVDALLGSLDDPATAPIAADSLGYIVGLGIEGPFSVAGTPESLDDGLAEDDPVPELSAYDDLPAPHVAKVRAWWLSNAHRFDPTLRYVRGLPWATTTVCSELARAATWRRPALRLALGPAASTLDLRTWAHQQRQWSPRLEHAAPLLELQP